MAEVNQRVGSSGSGAPALGHLALGVTTYLRPVGLGRLLDAIAALDASSTTRITVIVVDNDAAGSAGPVLDDARIRHGLHIVSAVESRRGVTHARNKVLELVRESDADWMGWLDDDEAPRPDWLARLAATQAATGADVVSGRPSSVYEPDAPAWIVASGAFDAEHFRTASPYPYFHTRTSGVIMRADVIPPEGFDNRLALTGGEDRVFFTRIHRAGHQFVWDDEAIVDEWIPTSRVSLRWLTRRWFRIGVTRSLTLLYLDDPSLLRRARRVLGGLWMASRGTLDVVLSARHGRSRMLASSRLALLGLGASWGAFGLHVHEYRTTQGA